MFYYTKYILYNFNCLRYLCWKENMYISFKYLLQ